MDKDFAKRFRATPAAFGFASMKDWAAWLGANERDFYNWGRGHRPAGGFQRLALVYGPCAARGVDPRGLAAWQFTGEGEMPRPTALSVLAGGGPSHPTPPGGTRKTKAMSPEEHADADAAGELVHIEQIARIVGRLGDAFERGSLRDEEAVRGYLELKDMLSSLRARSSTVRAADSYRAALVDFAYISGAGAMENGPFVDVTLPLTRAA